MVGWAKAEEQGMRVGGDLSQPFLGFHHFESEIKIYLGGDVVQNFPDSVPGGGSRRGAALPLQHTSMVQAEVANHFQQVASKVFSPGFFLPFP